MFDILTRNIPFLIPFGMAFLFFICGMGLLVSPFFSADKKIYFWLVLLLAIGIFISLSLGFYKYTVDDAYISLRYARNFANGYGLVFSTDGSTPVEGYTNFLWVLVETPLFILKVADNLILHSIKVIGISFGVASIITECYLLRLINGNDRVGLIGALLLSAIPQLAFWAIGGLETTMFIFWILIGLYSYISEKRNRKAHKWSIVFFILMALTRPEGLLIILLILISELTTNLMIKDKTEKLSRIKDLLPGIIIFAVFFCLYFIWRYNYYGYLLPNTFYARSSELGVTQIFHRLYQMSPFIVFLLPLIAFASFGYFRFNSIEIGEMAILTGMLVFLFAFSFASKTEWMPGYRYELPFIPILILFVSIGIHKYLFINGNEPLFNWKEFMSKLLFLMCIGFYLVYPVIDLQRLGNNSAAELSRAHVTLGKWLGRYAPSDSSYASFDMGAVPYFSKQPKIIDISPEGILSSHTTHYGYDINYFLSLNPSFIVLQPESYPIDDMDLFYVNDKFKQNYQLLFSFAFRKNYILDVYKRNDIYIPTNALDEGKKLAELSFREAFSNGK